MARQNIEDEWWSDPRRSHLMIRLGCPFKADGAAFNAWRLAEKYWKQNKRLIPIKDWEEARLPDALLEEHLAERRDDYIYMRGSEERFAWWFERKESGRKGGEAKAKNALAKPSLRPSSATDSYGSAKQNVPSSSSSSSFSVSKEKEGEEEKALPLGGKLVELWQKHSGEMRKVLDVGHDRMQKIRERLTEKPDLEYWEQVVKKMAANKFFLGENKIGWKGTFDWFLEPGNATKVLEGHYDSKENQNALDISGWK